MEKIILKKKIEKYSKFLQQNLYTIKSRFS